jgi:hypothetical protein
LSDELVVDVFDPADASLEGQVSFDPVTSRGGA